MSKLLYFSALAEHSAEQLTKSREQWTAFLTTVARLYKYPYYDNSACNMAEYLTKEMAKRQGVTEQLKAMDMMKWVGMMNNIRACVDEIVLNDIVYS